MKRLELLQNELGNVSLYEDERKQMRDSLMAYMEKVPVRTEDEFIVPRSSRFGLMSGIVVALLLVSGGVSFAAAHSLPGDKLYPVKVGVNEKVRGFLAFSAEHKAYVQADLATERLKEAEILNTQSKLDENTSETLRTNFNAHVEAFQASVTKLEAHDTTKAQKAHADFESRINVHSAILPSMVGAHTIATTSTTSNVQHSDSNLNKVITPPHVTASTTSTITTDLPIKADVKANTSETINVKTPEVPASTKLEVKDTTKLNVLQ